MTSFCHFSLSIVKIAALRSLLHLLDVHGSHFSHRVSSHFVLVLCSVVNIALGDLGLSFFFHSSEKHFCLFVEQVIFD